MMSVADGAFCCEKVLSFQVSFPLVLMNLIAPLYAVFMIEYLNGSILTMQYSCWSISFSYCFHPDLLESGIC